MILSFLRNRLFTKFDFHFIHNPKFSTMKKFFALCILLIGLVAMPPGNSIAANYSPESCLTQQMDAPAVSVQITDNFAVQYLTQANFVVQMEATQPPGDITDKLIVMRLPDVPMIYVDRICQLYLAANQKPPNLQGLQSNQKNSINPIEIRADSQI